MFIYNQKGCNDVCIKLNSVVQIHNCYHVKSMTVGVNDFAVALKDFNNHLSATAQY